MADPLDPVLAEWQARVLRAEARDEPIVIRGGGSKGFLGGESPGELLDTRAWRGIVSYEPSELVVTVRAGTPLIELEAALSERKQMLAFEPPHFGPATVGGMVAAGLSGPRRATAGAVRDHLLGVRLMDGRGDILRFGGQVMKNVAGYDVSRLMAGAMGTLGILLDVSLKVLPKPAAECTVRLAQSQTEAIQALNRWGAQPLPISATCWVDEVLHVRLSGAAAAVDAALARIGGTPLDDVAQAAYWQSVREHAHPYFSGAAPLWRCSMPSAATLPETVNAPLIEWGGALRWIRDGEIPRNAVECAGGHVALFRGGVGGASRDAFASLSPAMAELHRRLKSAFDPAGVFNRKRFAPEW